MTDEARAARNAYRREWNRRNKDKLKEYQARYWAKKAEEQPMDKIDLITTYNTLLSKYTKLCDFLKRVEEGSSPIHDDYPVSELYEQKVEMEKELEELKGRMRDA